MTSCPFIWVALKEEAREVLVRENIVFKEGLQFYWMQKTLDLESEDMSTRSASLENILLTVEAFMNEYEVLESLEASTTTFKNYYS